MKWKRSCSFEIDVDLNIPVDCFFIRYTYIFQRISQVLICADGWNESCTLYARVSIGKPIRIQLPRSYVKTSLPLFNARVNIARNIKNTTLLLSNSKFSSIRITNSTSLEDENYFLIFLKKKFRNPFQTLLLSLKFT